MREFICVVCGKLAIDRGSRQDAKCCSDKCRNRYRYLKTGATMNSPSCKYNEGVGCEIQRCENCGWNPMVEKKRKESLHV